jgi:hypothetical protein
MAGINEKSPAGAAYSTLKEVFLVVGSDFII